MNQTPTQEKQHHPSLSMKWGLAPFSGPIFTKVGLINQATTKEKPYTNPKSIILYIVAIQKFTQYIENKKNKWFFFEFFP